MPTKTSSKGCDDDTSKDNISSILTSLLAYSLPDVSRQATLEHDIRPRFSVYRSLWRWCVSSIAITTIVATAKRLEPEHPLRRSSCHFPIGEHRDAPTPLAVLIAGQVRCPSLLRYQRPALDHVSTLDVVGRDLICLPCVQRTTPFKHYRVLVLASLRRRLQLWYSSWRPACRPQR